MLLLIESSFYTSLIKKNFHLRFIVGAPENRMPENLQLPLYYLQKKFKPRTALPEFSTNMPNFNINTPKLCEFSGMLIQIKSKGILKLCYVLLEIDRYYEVLYSVKEYHSKLRSFLENCLLIYILCLPLCMYNLCQPIFHRH